MQKLPFNIVCGDYICSHLIAGNAEGAVYKAHHQNDTNTRYAIRIIRLPAKKTKPDVITKCNTHMATVKSVNAPHIVPVLDYGNNDLEYYLVMPYIEGKSIRTLVKETDRQPVGASEHRAGQDDSRDSRGGRATVVDGG